jgi:hypothetical protein
MFDRDPSKTFIVDSASGTIRVLRGDQSHQALPGRPPAMNTVLEVEGAYFDREHLESLLIDLENTKKELRETSSLCKEMGDPL